MSIAPLLALALCLDAIAGEPRALWSRLPHPAVLMGRAVSACEQALNTGAFKRAKGTAAIILLCLITGLIAWALQHLGTIPTFLLAAILLAQRSLVDHVKAVATGLRQSEEAGRTAVSMIVSRDVSNATPSATARSAIESLSENFSDGVIAPAFWFLIAGLPGITIYKMVNTADSMVGYLTPRHAEYGWASARLDDVLNWIPARLTALLICVAGGALSKWRAICADAKLHRSPNAGWPEAAIASSMGIALAGPRSYHGKVRELAWVNGDGRRELTPADIDVAVSIVWKSWSLALITVCCLGGFLWVF